MTTDDRLRIGMFGCGLIGRFHARSLQQVSDRATLVSVFDIDRDRAQTFAEEFGTSIAPTEEQLIATCDAVYVCTWTAAHDTLVRLAVDAAKPVFCEKPLSTDLESATALTDYVLAAEVTNQVGLILRRSPAMRWVAQRLASGIDGDVMSIVFRDDQYLPTQGMYASTWRGDPALAGAGTLIEHSIHDLDLLDWWIGPIVSVTAATEFHHELDGIEDQATVLMRNAAGAIATLSSTWHDNLERPSQRRIEILCREGMLTVEGDWNGPVRWEHPDGSGSLDGAALVAAVRSDQLTQNPDREFVDAIIGGHAAHPDFSTAQRAHALVDAAYRSAAGGGRVESLPI